MKNRLQLSLLGVLLVCAIWPAAAQAQSYPSRTITMVVPFAAGGLTDVPARILAVSYNVSMLLERRIGSGDLICETASMFRSQHVDFSGVSLTNSSEPAVYEIKQLDTLEELVQSYRLRYEVYADLGYLRHPNKSKLEIDEYDAWAIPFGAFDATSRTLIGTLRLVTKQPQSDFSRLVQKVLELFADDSLAMQARAPRPHILPSIVSDKIDQALAAFNTENFIVSELSRSVVGHNFRGSGVSRSLMELGLAQAAFGGPALLIGSYLPGRLPMYAKYGYLKLPQTDLDLFDSVGQIAIAGICRTDRLPRPTRSHVDELLRSMRTNAAEHTTETDCGSRILYRLQGTPGIGPCAIGRVGSQWTADI